ncbi:MAG: ArnT family glycosyltransferase [Candidatus Bruticola sp.]
MHNKLNRVKLFKLGLALWTIAWLIGSLLWSAQSSPYCFGESSVLKLYAYTAYVQGNCQELMHGPALFTLSRPFIAIFGCTDLTFSLVQSFIFIICAILTAYIASKLYGSQTGLLSFMLLTFSLSTAKGLRTFLLDYPVTIPLLLMYLFYLHSAGFKKLWPCLGMSFAIWLGAQTKYSFLPVWAMPLSAALLMPYLHRALRSSNRSRLCLSATAKKNFLLLLSSLISLGALALFIGSAKQYLPYLHQHSRLPLPLQLETVLAIFSSVFSLYKLHLNRPPLHPAWQRFYRGLAACTLGAGLSAWSYLPHLQAIWGHTTANYHHIPDKISMLINIPSAWFSYFSSVCQDSLSPLPWFLLSAIGLITVCFNHKQRRRSLPFIGGLIFLPILIQTLPWDHAYQRFFAPLLPWWAILAAYTLRNMTKTRTGLYSAVVIVLYLWLHAALISWAWASPSISAHLYKLDPSCFLSEGLSLNIPRAERTFLENLQESFHPLQPLSQYRRQKTNNQYGIKLSVLPIMRQPWFEELVKISDWLAADGANTKRSWYLAIIAEFDGRELKGESPAMELRLRRARQNGAGDRLHITGINNPEAYPQAIGPRNSHSLTVLITNTGVASPQLQQDLSPWLSQEHLIGSSQDSSSGLTLLYFASPTDRQHLGVLFSEGQENF